MIVQGFDGIQASGGEETGGLLRWYCAPDSWKTDDDSGRREGADGRWQVETVDSSSSQKTSQQLTIYPPAKKDFWRKTYYEPLLVKDDGPFLHCTLPTKVKPRKDDSAATFASKSSSNNNKGDLYYTVETSFLLMAVCQFDQAGLFLRLGPKHWIKTGIEVVDGKARLSCVVTNIFSDWSTQPWPSTKAVTARVTTSAESAVIKEKESVQVECQIRIHCRGTSFVVEAKLPPTASAQDDDDDSSTWEFIRIAHLSTNSKNDDDDNDDAQAADGWLGPSPEPGEMWVGVFACCPEDQRGGHATFTQLQVQAGSAFEHNADGNVDE